MNPPDLKKYVIDIAVVQINQHSDMNVTYTQRKTGRVVSHLIFAFDLKKSVAPKKTKSLKAKKNVDVSAPETIFGVLKADIEKLARPGESYEDAASRIKKMNLS